MPVVSIRALKAFLVGVTKPGKFSDGAILYWLEIFCIGRKDFLGIHDIHIFIALIYRSMALS
jgi:hypothetical protein